MNTRTAGVNNEVISPDFLDFVVCLNQRNVAYVLVGGYAMGVHGVVRATGDIDFLYRRTAANVRRLCTAMEDFGAPPPVIDRAALLTPETVTQFGEPPFRIDLLSTIDGVTFAKVWAGAVTATIQGQTMRVIGLAELRANKAATGRPKDAEDLRKLRTRRRPRRR